MVERMKCQVHLVQWCLDKSRFVVIQTEDIKNNMWPSGKFCVCTIYIVKICPYSLTCRFSFEGVSNLRKASVPNLSKLGGFLCFAPVAPLHKTGRSGHG